MRYCLVSDRPSQIKLLYLTVFVDDSLEEILWKDDHLSTL